ncbi:MAG TPA: MFS transporter [Pseudomonadales bacterium]|nr:MFS transporter [Pseudomonadales bacterium]
MLNRSFTLFWCARVASMAATQMLMVAVGWQIYAITSSAFDLGMVGLISFIPQVLLVLVTGQVADHFDRQRVTCICQMIECVVVAILALGSFAGWLTRNDIYGLVLFFGTARAFETPTLQTMLPSLVSADVLPRAISLSAAAMQTAIILGPAMGGWIYVLGAHIVYGTSATLFVIAAILVSQIEQVQAPQILRERPSFSTVFAGIGFIRQNPVVLGAISLDLFAVLLGGATALLPIYARDILHTGAWGLGILRSAPAVGALLMSFWLSKFPINRHTGKKLFLGVASFGTATIVFAMSGNFLLTSAALLVLGAADMVSVVIRGALVQLETPDEMRGRVNAVNSLFIGTSNQLGEFESGITAAWLGTVPAVLLGGAGTIIVATLWMRLFPELLARDQLQEKPDKTGTYKSISSQ